MKLKFTIWIIIFYCSLIQAQQATQYSWYQLNPYAFNPGYAGMDESLSFTGVYRTQWLGLEGNPISQNVSIHSPLYIFGGGIGINANNVEIGAHRRTKATFSYAKYFSVGDAGQLSIGIAGGILQQTYFGSQLRTPEGEYIENIGSINHNDDLLSENNTTALIPTFGLGIFYKNEQLQLGLSADNVAETTLQFDVEESTSSVRTTRHYYVYGSYRLDIGDAFSLTPSILGKSDLVEHQTDVSVLIGYKDIFYAGASFRGFNANTTDAIAILAGMQINANVRFGYAYDITLSKLNTVTTGSHEIILQYNLNKKIGAGIPPPIIYNPRSL